VDRGRIGRRTKPDVNVPVSCVVPDIKIAWVADLVDSWISGCVQAVTGILQNRLDTVVDPLHRIAPDDATAATTINATISYDGIIDGIIIDLVIAASARPVRALPMHVEGMRILVVVNTGVMTSEIRKLRAI
jgi:hypothetical protein